MKVEKSSRLTMLLDDKTEMASVMTKPNEECVVLRNMFLMQVTVDKCDINRVRCFDHRYERKRTRKHKTADIANEGNESENTKETFRNVQNGMWRWTYATDVTCSALATAA